MNNWQVAWQEMRLGMGPGPLVPRMLGLGVLFMLFLVWKLAGMVIAMILAAVILMAFALVLATGAANVGQRRDEERFGPVPGTYGTIDIDAPMRRKPVGYMLRNYQITSWFTVGWWSFMLTMWWQRWESNTGLWMLVVQGFVLSGCLFMMVNSFLSLTLPGWYVRVGVYQGLWRMGAPRFLRRFWCKFSQPARQSYCPALKNPA